jgi:FkbM family methyltransferase
MAMPLNGELMVQRAVIDGCARAGRPAVLFDIGAHLGHWTVAALGYVQSRDLDLDKTAVFAFEPVIGTRDILERNLAEAGFAGQVVVSGLALSDTARSCAMNVIADGNGTNSLERDYSDGAQHRMITVETDSLAAFADRSGIDRIALVKCDTEGHDALVLRGAEPLLRDGRIDAFQFEYNHRWIYARRYLKDVFDFVNDIGAPYHVARVRPGCLEVLPAWHPEMERFFEANYILVHHDHAKTFKIHFGKYDHSNTYA